MGDRLKLSRGLLAYLLCFHTPLKHWWPAYLWVLGYAGDWAYQVDMRLAQAEKELSE